MVARGYRPDRLPTVTPPGSAIPDSTMPEAARHQFRLVGVHGRESFEALRRSSSRGSSGPLVVHYVPSQDPDAATALPARSSGIAFAISRNVGGAVQRNRLRRRLRAASSAFAMAPGSYLVRVDPKGRDLSYQELERHLEDAARRAVRRSES